MSGQSTESTERAERTVPLMVAPFRLDSLREAAAAAASDASTSEATAEASAEATAEAGQPSEPGRRERRRARRRRHRVRNLILVFVLLVVLGAGAFVGLRANAPDPVPTVTSALASDVHVATQPMALPWPQTGQGAVAVPALGIVESSPAETPVPVASLTKLMTAYVVLQDHPIGPGQPGPNVTVVASDVQDYDFDTVSDQSSALVSVGEVLTEQQLLAGMLVHSADDYADILARWDAGSAGAFVLKMNAAAAQLGMTHSHFVDASGINTGSQSTAGDIVKVAALDMDSPVVRAIVQMPNVTLPLAGTIRSYTPLLGLAGIEGVKSGYTVAAGGCDVVAVERVVHGQQVRILAAVTGQSGPDVLVFAGLHGLALVNAAAPLIGSAPVVTQGELAAHVQSGGRNVDARTAASASLLTWPGVTAQRLFVADDGLTDRARRGARVGTVVVTLGRQRVTVPVQLRASLTRPTWLQRIF